jgi:nucleotide-binding universal stress UspA family protein
VHSFDKILIGIAFSPNIVANIHEAVRLSNLFNAELVCVHVGDKTTEKELKLEEIFKQAPQLNSKRNFLFQKGSPV